MTGVVEALSIKAAGGELSEDQIRQLVQDISTGAICGEQMGAMLMAVYQRGMTRAETTALTRAMMLSGRVMQWPAGWRVGDKHSTGGVGDKVSLPLTPALAVCGLKVPMISGRGLMHTGGTLDKLESIPGLNVCLSEEAMLSCLSTVGCVITGQTSDLVPADRRMYAARDITATVASTPLIVSSILSKKGAESLNALVLDVKYGDGAFLKTLPSATELATQLVDTMTDMEVTTTAIVSCMDHPIGRMIGNALEVREALDCLQGAGPPDLLELVLELGGELLSSAGLYKTAGEGQLAVKEALRSGAALDKFRMMICAQGVSEQVAEGLCSSPPGTWPTCLPRAECTTEVVATKTGVIVGQTALSLAEVSCQLGAGRQVAGQPVMHDVGLQLVKVVGEHVKTGEAWAVLHHRRGALTEAVLLKVGTSLTVDPDCRPHPPHRRVVKRVMATTATKNV